MHVPFLDLKAQYSALEKPIQDAVDRVLRSCAFASGPEVEAFEKMFAAYCESDHAVGVSSGTAALELLLRAHDIGPGDEVITVANTFFATAEAISLVGATPVLVDARESDALMDPARLDAAITKNTKAIIPVHLYGQPADMDAVLDVAKASDILVIEDSCQAHGARYKGSRAGSLADAGAFSFYPGKNLGAYGEGGAVTTSNADIAERVRQLRDHGSPKKYEHAVIGRNDRMDELQGAILQVKLQHLDAWNEARRSHANSYRDRLEGHVALLEEQRDRESVYHLFIARVPNRESVQGALRDAGIATGIHYPIPIHLQPAYGGTDLGRFPVSEALASDILSLPMFPELTEEQISYVAETLRAVV